MSLGGKGGISLARYVLAALGSLCILNICLWILDFPMVHSYPANDVKKRRYPSRQHVFRDEDYSRYSVNSYGLLGADPVSREDASVYRIAVFGDSLVEALKVSYEDRFTTRLEQMLIPPPPYQRIEAWNFGFSGDNTGNAYARWLYQAKGIPFNLVIFSFNETDVFENRPEDTQDPSGAYLIQQPDGNFVLDLSRTQQSIGWLDLQVRNLFGRLIYSAHIFSKHVRDHLKHQADRFAKVLHGPKPVSALEGSDNSVMVEMPPFLVENTCKQLVYVQSAIAAEGVPVVLLGLPAGNTVLPSEINKNMLTHRAYLAVAECLTQMGRPFLDAYPVLSSMAVQSIDPCTDWEKPGAHLNRRGNAIVAKSLRNFLIGHVEFGLVGGGDG